MSTTIRVDVALAGLLTRLKGQQNAQRLAYLQQQARLSFEQELAQALAQQQLPPELLAKQNRKPRKEDLSAFRSPDLGINLALGWVSDTAIYSGDGTASLTIPPQYSSTELAEPIVPTPEGPCVQYLTSIGPGGAVVSSGSSSGFSVVLPAGNDGLIYASSLSSVGYRYYYILRDERTYYPLTNFCGDPVIEYYALFDYKESTDIMNDAGFCCLVRKSSVERISGGTLIDVLQQQHNSYRLGTVLSRPAGTPNDVTVTTPSIALVREAATNGMAYYGSYGSLLSNYGISTLSSLYGSTPILYQTLSSDLAAFGFDYASWNDYTQIDSYFSAAKCPYVAELIDPFLNSGKYEARVWKRPFMVDGVPVDGSALRAPYDIVPATPWAQPAGISEPVMPMMAWDWGAPSYCAATLSSQFGITL